MSCQECCVVFCRDSVKQQALGQASPDNSLSLDAPVPAANPNLEHNFVLGPLRVLAHIQV
jgi:hypothetical protein